MFCSKCGKKLRDDETICPKCGNPVSALSVETTVPKNNTAVPPVSTINSMNTTTIPSGQKKKLTKKTIIILTALLVILIIMLSKCGNSNSASPEIITRNLKVGDQIEFGSYEQDNDTGNGAEPILWDVIGQNNGRYLLISHYVLDYMAYEKDNDEMVRLANGEMGWDITWASSSIRQWLNSDFMDMAFDNEEKTHIVKVRNKNTDFIDNYGQEVHYRGVQGGIGGEDTDDNVFLLSVEEFIQYYRPEHGDGITSYIHLASNAISGPTTYARAQGAPTDSLIHISAPQNEEFYKTHYEGKMPPEFNDKYTSWMLRSTGTAYDQSTCMFISYLGVAEASHNCFRGGGIRPAVWVTGIEKEATESELESADKAQKLYSQFIGNWQAVVITGHPPIDGKIYDNFRDVQIDEDFIEASDHVTCRIIHSADDITYHEENGIEYLYFTDMVGYSSGADQQKELADMRIHYDPDEEVMIWERVNPNGNWTKIGAYAKET